MKPPKGYIAAKASTGPRSIERGVWPGGVYQVREHRASTGPRSIERGVTVRLMIVLPFNSLQRGRAQLSAEFSCSVGSGVGLRGASTGPRSIERGVHSNCI